MDIKGGEEGMSDDITGGSDVHQSGGAYVSCNWERKSERSLCRSH